MEHYNTASLPDAPPSLTKEGVDDLEQQRSTTLASKESAFKNLGWLARLLALWILLAMIVSILLGNFVPGVEAALRKGELVGVSLPIGVCVCVRDFPSVCGSE